MKRLSKSNLLRGRLEYPEETKHLRPATRAECVDGSRPCPFVSCKHHLYLDVTPKTGAIKLNFPDLEVEQLTESCTLDVADRGGATLEEVGAIANITRERIRQIEVKALALIAASDEADVLREFVDGEPRRKVRRLTLLKGGR